MTRADGRRSAAAEFFVGASYLLRGFGHWRHAPGSMFLGWVPAILVFAAFVAVIVLLGINLESLANLMTPFAEPWDEPWRTSVRVGVAVALLLSSVFLGIFLFTTVTLIVGAAVYEWIWASVEARFGAVPSSGVGFWRGLLGDIGDALRMLLPTILLGLAIFALHLVPVVGTILSVTLGAVAGGRILALDLTGFALGARRLSLRERRIALRGNRALSMGFGVAVYFVFLIPGGTIIAMPAAVAGATLLSRRILGEPVSAPETRSAS
jgi:CysZ protein